MNPGRRESPVARPGSELLERFSGDLTAAGVPARGDRIVVAVSGGEDSLVLLHLLRFGIEMPPLDLLVAHFDHRMRPESREDALWVKGLSRAWGVPIELGAARSSPASEEEARELRYEFLADTLSKCQGRWIFTAHHADDQAETVLFRALRGTGLRGLAGIPVFRRPGIHRPLLPFFRAEIRAYARTVGLRHRRDSSNLDLTRPRNLIRNEILPRLEREAAPRARESLLRLARLARENETAWKSLLPGLLEGVAGEEDGQVFIVRSAFLACHPAVQTRLLREVLRRHGIGLDESGTRAVLEFTRTGASGRSMDLPGGFGWTREFDRLKLETGREKPGDRALVIGDATPGAGYGEMGGRKIHAVWGDTASGECDEIVELRTSALDFPLRLRAWAPGDRMVLSYGTKKLRKLMAEARIPRSDRGAVPVLVDARGRVIWAAGLPVSTRAQAREGEPSFFLGFRNAHER